MVAQTEKVQQFLHQDPVPFLIGGRSTLNADKKSIRVENPADQSVLAMVSKADANDAEAAVNAADGAFQVWKQLSTKERAQKINAFADLCEQHAEELAQLETLDVGKPIENARGFDIPFGIDALRYYATLIESTEFESELSLPDMKAKSVRLPYGVVAFVFPWNFPLTLCLWGIAPALAAGNTVVIKPAELTPLSTLYLSELIKQAGFPDGVINILPGGGSEIGAVLSSHPKVKYLSFTGSTSVGKTLGQQCGANLKPVKLELGGKGAAVVFEDADLDFAAEGLAGAITLNTGQVCCTATRWIIHESVYDDFVGKVKQKLAETLIQTGMEESSQMGPLVSQAQQDRVLDYIAKGQAQGAELICGGKKIEGRGYFVEATLLSGSEDNICFKEEIFGPVAYLTKFSSEQEACQQVNSLDYGLANSVWTKDQSRAERVAKALVSGNSWINAHNVFAYGLPYGGVNASGLGGGVNSLNTLFDYTRSLSIAEPTL